MKKFASTLLNQDNLSKKLMFGYFFDVTNAHNAHYIPKISIQNFTKLFGFIESPFTINISR